MDATTIRTAVTAAIGSIILSMYLGSSTSAQTVLDHPSTEQIIEALSPAASRLLERKPGSRSLRGITVEPSTTTVPVSINLRVQFDYDRATLTAEAQQTLNTLGSALSNKELDGLNFTIIGHTDAKGENAYNQELSQRRALAVVEFLVKKQGLEARRLTSKGRGELDLLVPEDPENPENRRVQIEARSPH